MSFRILVMKTSPSAGDLTALQTALGTAGGTSALTWEVSGGVSFIDISPNEATFLKLEQTYSTLVSTNGLEIHVYYADSQAVYTTREAKIATYTGGVANFGATSQVEYRDQRVAIENLVIDGRNIAFDKPPLALYNCTGTVKNVLVFGAHSNAAGTVTNGWASAVSISRCYNLTFTNCWAIGGKMQGGITVIGKPLTKRVSNIRFYNCRVAGDVRLDWEGFGWWPGEPGQFQDSIELYGYNPASYFAGKEYLQYSFSSNLIAYRGNKSLVRVQKINTPASKIYVSYAHIGGNDGNVNLSGTQREWWLSWQGAPSEVRAVCTADDMINKIVELTAYVDGVETVVPAGLVGWYCQDPTWYLQGIEYHNCRAYGDPASAPVASGFTGYGVNGLLMKDCWSQGFDDRAFGFEYGENVTITGCVCGDGTANDQIQISFFGRNVHIYGNTVKDIKFDSNGYPNINITTNGFQTYTTEFHTSSSLPSAGSQSNTTNWFGNVKAGKTTLSPTFITVSEANLATASVPGI